MNKLYKKVNAFVGSSTFFWIILGYFILSATWVALSFSFPLPYDEYFHIPIIQAYSEGISPFVSNQPVIYDRLGDLNMLESRWAGLYHYLLSFVYSLVSFFTDSFTFKVVSLRMLNIAMAASGIYFFAELFIKQLGFKPKHTNIGLLFFVMLPVVSLVAAHVNYDNMLFPATALFLIYFVKTLKNKNINIIHILNFFSIGLFASLIKFSFLPIFAFGVMVSLVKHLRTYGRGFFKNAQTSFKNSSRKLLIFSLIPFLVLSTLFTANYIANIVKYRSPIPSCRQTLSVERCLSNPLINEYSNIRATANERPQLPIYRYFHEWLIIVIDNFSWTANNTQTGLRTGSATTLFKTVVYVAALAAPLAIAYSWRLAPHTSVEKRAILAVAVVLLVSVFLKNYDTHIHYRTYSAIQSRYLLSVLPIFMVFTAASIGAIVRRRSIKLMGLLLTGFLLLQGGLITHIRQSDESWYFENSRISEINIELKALSEGFIYKR